MPPDDQTAIDRLDDALDRLVNDGRDPAQLPPDTAALTEAHRQVRGRDRTPGPTPAFVERLLEDLMPPTAPSLGTNGRIAATDRLPRGPDPRIRPDPRLPREHRWGRAQFAAALLLVVLGLGYLALAPLRSGPERPPSIPGAVIPATPADASAGETLLAAELPAELVPSGYPVAWNLFLATMPAGLISTWDAATGPCCQGFRFEYVLSGSQTVVADGETRVARATGDGTLTTYPGGTELTLAAGDSLIVANAVKVTYTNEGSEPVEMLTLLLTDEDTFFHHPAPSGWLIGRTFDPEPRVLPAGPAVVRLRHITLAPKEIVEPAPGAVMFAVVLPKNAAGTPVPSSLGSQSSGGIKNLGQTAVDVYTFEVVPNAATAATPALNLTP